ncbi:Ubiquitin fusion degradation protein UFD1 [Macrophomina phaseolina MS6]|uniref:Ubiquitin fusion degradation protein UFD1 n=1 Tax=Macrophomina phaseolina (strain MS6) TaxID=1126212 RepID=K2SCH7_MACPH|nr:Ubiquitin fusion degradation protein UFD1 [Macrophomina phaseolina MS6]
MQSSSNQPHTSTFDPFNPHTFAAERQARELQYQDRIQQLPHPLTFRLVNPDNGKAVYAGIREFSAGDGEVVLSKFLRESLGLDGQDADSGDSSSGHTSDEDATMANGVAETAIHDRPKPRITVHAKQLPKGTFVKLRPLEAGYDPADWKSLLEQHMRTNFTTLTNGEILVIPGGRGPGGKKEEFRFLIDGFKPEAEGICVVDTDLEVDIEALNEEQARETLKRIAAKAQRLPGTAGGSSTGGKLDLLKVEHGQVLDGEYVDYELPSWIRAQGIEIELSGVDDDEEIDLYVSPFGPRQRAKPRADEHVFGDVSSTYPKRIRLRPTNVELEDAESLLVSVHAYTDDTTTAEKPPKTYQLRATPFDPNDSTKSEQAATPSLDTQPLNPDDVQCKNCQQWVPRGSLFLHENFCLRNNIVCPKGCGQVFQKRSEAFQNHWHCPHDTFHGNTSLSHTKHDAMFHTSHICDHCDRTFTSLSQLAHHKTTVCPGKHILCQFCHLEVPQEGDPDAPNPEALLSNLTPHELADGARTTECHLCNKITRLRDMATHLRHHEFEKLSRPAPRLCRNANCGRTLDGATKAGGTRAAGHAGPGNDIGLCSVCFGPLYVSMYDPDGKALRRRVERRYLAQLLTGCGKEWCRNEMCKTGRGNRGIDPPGLSAKEALPLIRPLLDGLVVKDGEAPSRQMQFCTDEASQKRRNLAEMLAAEEGNISEKGGYGLEWCVAAMEAEGGDLLKAREWLKGWAPQRGETA